MTGSMDRRADDNSDNESEITQLTDSVDLDQAEIPTTTTSNTNPDSSIVLDINPSNTAPVTQPLTTTAQTNRKRAKQTTTTSGPSTVPTPAATGSTQPRTRRSTRISELASPDADQAALTPPPGSSSSTGAAISKGKKRAQAEETEAGSFKKQTTTTASSTDRKGKKRADPPPEEEPFVASSSRKKSRKAPQSLIDHLEREKRRKDLQSSKGQKPAKTMPRRPAAKGKKSTGPSGSEDKSKKGDSASRTLIDDSMGDEWPGEGSGSGALGEGTDDDFDEMNMNEDEDDDEDQGDEDEDDAMDHAGSNPFRSGMNLGGPGGMASRLAQLASESGMHLDEATAAAIFGSGFRSFGGMSSGLAGRFKRLKAELTSSNPSTRHSALRECSELLLVSNEDTLGGAFSTTSFATEFIAILDGRPNINPDAPTEVVRPPDEMDEDAQLAAALAMSAGEDMPSGGGNENEMETQLIACRCLAHLMEALPGSGHTLVQLGAVPVLCNKLNEISYIELAEQTLSTMEKISSEHPSAVVKEGGLGALLNYLDFFSTNVQRTAVNAAANCCRNLSGDSYQKIKDVFPTLRQTLTSTDQRLVESATLAVVRTIEAFRHNSAHLEGLLDLPTAIAINSLLMPSGGSPLLSSATYTHLLKALTSSARGSAKVTVNFLEAGMTNTVYQILTGVLPPSHDEDEQGMSAGGQGLSGGVADMAVLQNLAHRPKDQVEEALALITELLPPLPREGVFDFKAYNEKAFDKIKAGVKGSRKPRRSSRAPKVSYPGLEPFITTPPEVRDPTIELMYKTPPIAVLSSSDTQPDLEMPSGSSQAGPSDDSTIAAELGFASSGPSKNILAKTKKAHEQQADQRLELLKMHPDLVAKFVKTILPVLVDVYAASIAVRVRTKVLSGLAKAVAFTDADSLWTTLRSVPMASFLGTIISSETNPHFVLSALQLVELLVNKLPDVYQTSFIREGVVYEIEKLAETETKAAQKAKEDDTPEDVKPDADELAQAGPSMPSVLTRPPVPFPSVLEGSKLDFDYMRHLFEAEGGSGPMSSMWQMGTRKPIGIVIDTDSNIWRARVLGAKKIFDVEGDDKNEAKLVLDKLSALNSKLSKQAATEGELYDALKEIASQFSSAGSSLSSFELLRGGVIDGLLQFVDIDGTVSSEQRRSMLYEIFAETAPSSSASPMTILVKRLHESLGRLETFSVESAFNGVADATRPSASALSRTLRVKMIAEPGQDTPKSLGALVLSIQAIAPLSALHDYLRPRVADSNYGTGSGISRMLAAMGVAGGAGASRGSLAIPGGSAAGPGSSGRTLAVPGRASAQATSSSAPDLASSAPQDGPLGALTKIPAPKGARRRSARLSAQQPEAEAEAEAAGPSTSAEAPTSALATTGPLSSSAPAPSNIPMLPMDLDFDDEYSDEEYGEEMFESEMAAAAMSRPQEKVVNMNVASDGSGIEVKTPEGTRVATPSQALAAGASAPGAPTAAAATATPSPSGAATPRTASYAGAVKTAPTDFHLAFSLDGKPVNMQDTVYGIVHKHHKSQPASAAFGQSVTLMWRKVDGPAPTGPVESITEPEAAPSPSSAIPSESPTNKILRLLKVVHELTVEARGVSSRNDQMEETLFVNNKLTAKLTRQMEEVMILASGCLPDWATELPRNYAFLFPFETRYSFLQSTSFGYARLIAKHMTAHQANTRNTRRFDELSHLARINRQKVRISRAQLLESCAKVMQLYGNSNGILEVEYFDEIGTGLGPTLEFYSQSSLQMARRDIKLWRDEDGTKPGEYVFHPKGLFPAPISPTDDSTASGLHWFNTLGIFIGRALLDSRIIDLNLNKVLLQLILGIPIKKNIATLKTVDEQLARSLERLQSYLYARKEIEALPLGSEAKRNKLGSLTVGGATLGDLSLDFTVPGHDLELKVGGKNIDVDDSNLEEYLTLVLDMTLGSGIANQIKSLQDGFSTIMPINDLKIFSPEEIGLLIGDAEEDWSKETLESVIKADHGYNLDSRAVKNLIDVMSSYTVEERRAFLQFITGAPKLPIGGFRGLTPPFTVVRKPHEPPFKADDYLPSVMTCAQYLKMPDYTTREILLAQLDRAIKDGGQSFHLS